MDLRLPIGALFAIFGAIITAYGFVSNPQIYEKSLGINVNVDWGVVLLAFGALMLLFAFLAKPDQTEQSAISIADDGKG